MERKVTYKNKEGDVSTSYFYGYDTVRKIREHLKKEGSKIIAIYKPIECEHCNGEGIWWKEEKER